MKIIDVDPGRNLLDPFDAELFSHGPRVYGRNRNDPVNGSACPALVGFHTARLRTKISLSDNVLRILRVAGPYAPFDIVLKENAAGKIGKIRCDREKIGNDCVVSVFSDQFGDLPPHGTRAIPSHGEGHWGQ